MHYLQVFTLCQRKTESHCQNCLFYFYYQKFYTGLFTISLPIWSFFRHNPLRITDYQKTDMSHMIQHAEPNPIHQPNQLCF